jgi:hypothetical protein
MFHPFLAEDKPVVDMEMAETTSGFVEPEQVLDVGQSPETRRHQIDKPEIVSDPLERAAVRARDEQVEVRRAGHTQVQMKVALPVAEAHTGIIERRKQSQIHTKRLHNPDMLRPPPLRIPAVDQAIMDPRIAAMVWSIISTRLRSEYAQISMAVTSEARAIATNAHQNVVAITPKRRSATEACPIPRVMVPLLAVAKVRVGSFSRHFQQNDTPSMVVCAPQRLHFRLMSVPPGYCDPPPNVPLSQDAVAGDG